MSNASINLGPDGISSSYNIPANDWAIANKRVSVVLDRSRDPALQQKLHALPNYNSLVSVSSTWKTSTFDSLISFSSDLANFAQTDVQSYLTVLNMILNALQAGDKSMKTRLDNTVAGFISDSNQFSAQSAILTSQLKAFDLQMSESDISGGDPSDPVWSAFSLNAGLAFDVIEGRFQTISDDLKRMQTNIEEKLKKDHPIVVQIVDLPLAKSGWQSIAEYAAGFVANAPAQRKYLNGDW